VLELCDEVLGGRGSRRDRFDVRPPPRMTSYLPAGEVGYRGHDDVVLRLALFELWKSQCHMCEQPKLFADTEIDHIIPRTILATRLPDLILQHGLAADFHVDRPANLALICRSCNRNKSDRVLLGARSMTNLLETARRHAAEVDRRVREHATVNALTRGLIGAATADTRDPQTRRSYLRHAPAIVQTLALIDEDAVDFRVTRDFEVDIGGYHFMPVTLTLDARGRTAQSIIEDIGGCPLLDALRDSLTHLSAQARDSGEASIYRHCRDGDSLGSIGLDYVWVALGFVDLRRNGSRLTVRFAGEIHGSYSACLARTNQSADGLDTLSLSEPVDLAVSIAASWDLTGSPGRPNDVQAQVTADLLADARNEWWADTGVEEDRYSG
jgi:hypothetical protein